MTAKWKIIAGFIAMIAVTGVVAAVGYFGLADATGAFNEYGRMAKVNVRAANMVAHQLGAIAEIRQFLMTADQKAMERARDEIRIIRNIAADSKPYVRHKYVQDALNLMDEQTAQQMRLCDALEKSVMEALLRYEEDVRPALRSMRGELLVMIRSPSGEDVRIHASALDHLGALSVALSRFAFNRTQANADLAEEALAELGKDVEELQGALATPEGRLQFIRILKGYDNVMATSADMRASIAEGMEQTARIVALNRTIRESITKVSGDVNARMTEQGARTVQINATARKSAFTAAAGGLLFGILLGAFLILGLIRALRETKYNIVKYELTSHALGIAHWDMTILHGDALNPDNPFVWSPELRRMFGFPESADFPDVFANWMDRMHPGDRERVLRDFAAHIAARTGNTPFSIEYRIRMNDGEYRYIRAFGTTLRDKAGMPLRVAGAAEDITVQQQTRHDLNEMEKRVQLMMDSVPLAVTMWDKNLQLVDCSRNTLNLLKFDSKQDCMGRFMECMPEYQPDGRLSRDMMAEQFQLAFEKGYNRCEFLHQATDGEPIFFDVPLVRMEYEDDFVVVAYARDIREDKKMLDELARRDAMLAAQAHWYKSLLDAIPLPLSVSDADMKLTLVNAAAEKLFGKKREALLGQPCNCWNVPICGTADCSIARAKRGLKQTQFTHNGVSCLIDTEIIRDAAGVPSGFIEILHDVTEVENAARRQADEANEAKSAFLATISHEMRTPLNAVIGLSELTLDGGGLNEEAAANIENIYNAGSTLLSIVNDILDLSKIKSGKFEIAPHTYDVPSMVNDSITQTLLHIGSKPIRFVLDIDENMPSHLYGDDLRVKQIIVNLLSNAFKYTEKGTVELALSYARENESVWLTIRVSDTGVGIRPEDYARLFADYSQVDAKASRKAGGTGLGLSITKNLAEMMGGNVLVTSTYGKGSTFTTSIRQGFVNDEVIGAELADNLRNFRYAAGRRTRSARLNRIRLPYARVLVVDDHLTNLDVAKGLMRPYGMRIDCAASGQEAIDIIREEKVRYNAIFMDHMMPEMDGVEATRLIREIGTEYAGNIPIIALTANAIFGSEEMFLRNGFTAFISKPIDLMRLDEVLRRFVRDKAQEMLFDSGELDMRQSRDRRTGRERRIGQDRRASDRRDAAGPLPPDAKIDGLDIAKGLERFGGEESYVQVLRSYAVNTKPLLASIETVERENLRGYAVTVHGIKGSSRGICAGPAGDLAEALEHAAKAGNFDFVRENNPAFLESVWNLVAGITAMLDGMTESSRKPERDKPDSALLAKLKIACDSYDLDGIDAVMREMDGYEYTADDGLAAWLRDATARLDYARVAEKIAQL